MNFASSTGVGAGEEGGRDGEAEVASSIQVDNPASTRCLIDWEQRTKNGGGLAEAAVGDDDGRGGGNA
jgi:hypothetical protein